jgi:hypothetical protein
MDTAEMLVDINQFQNRSFLSDWSSAPFVRTLPVDYGHLHLKFG